MRKLIWFVYAVVFVAGCSDGDHSPTTQTTPPDIDTVFRSYCDGGTCHFPDDHGFARSLHDTVGGGLDLSSWSTLFAGSDHGAVVIPYAARFSHLVEHIEGTRTPIMPPGGLMPSEQTALIRDWIDNGALTEEGQDAFGDADERLFTTNQGVDAVTIIDEASLLEMRIWEVGDRTEIESPHGVQVSPSGRYFYVSMIATGDVFKYDAWSGQMIGKSSLGLPVALIKLSSSGRTLYVTTNFQVNNTGQDGSITVIRTSDMSVVTAIPAGISPHGITISRDGRWLYATAVYSDRVYVIDTETNGVYTVFDVASDVGPSPQYEPYHVGMGPKNASGYEDHLFVTCRKNGQVRIFQRVGKSAPVFSFVDSVLVGSTTNSKPIQLDVTPDGQFAYVANSNDSSVSVIRKVGTDFSLFQTITAQTDSGGRVHRLAQPNGVAVSRDGLRVYVSNRNLFGSVPPHHGGAGGVGLLSVIDIATNLIVKTIELQPDAYSVVWSP